MYSSSRRIALPPVRTRSIGVISLSRVRIGLIFSAEPSHAEAGPIRPPRRRYSSVSTANHIFRCARADFTRLTTSSSDPPACATLAPARAIRPSPPAARSESITVIRSTPFRSASCSFAWRADSTVPEMPPEMCTDTTSRPSSTSGSYTSRKSPIEGCEVVGRRSAERSRR